MDTPLYHAIQALMERGFSRFHTPGHKGRDLGIFSGVTPFDFTEVRGADSLFAPDGPIAETEALYTRLYATAGTFLSAGGSTLCIQAMLRLIRPLGQKVLIGRNAHSSAISALALLGMQPVWLYPETGSDLLPQPITPQAVEAALREHPDAAGVYVTSPDYFGKLSDIAGLADACHRQGIPLLVDNAHGAELFFLPERQHPMQLGADLCCDSLHKTLPVLTGGALLHVGDTPLARRHAFAAQAKAAMALFGSTSPSYLILLSMDLLLPRLADGSIARELAQTAARAQKLTALAAGQGFCLPKGPLLPTRLSLGFFALGQSRAAFDALLTRCRVEPEYQAGHYCVFLLSAQNRGSDYARLGRLITQTPKHPPLPVEEGFLPARQVCPSREALFAPRETLPLAQAVHRTAAEVVSRCPPGIPLLLPGEQIDENIAALLNKYGIFTISVLK